MRKIAAIFTSSIALFFFVSLTKVETQEEKKPRIKDLIKQLKNEDVKIRQSETDEIIKNMN